jgi:tellurite resistance protein
MSAAPLRPMPPPLVMPPRGLWRTTPPAIFGPMLGLFGLGILLRTLSEVLVLAPLAQLAEALLGAVVLLHGFALLAYVAKPLRRPAALIEDLGTVPGKSGVGAALAALHLSAGALVPYAPGLALGMVLVGLVAQAMLMALVAWLVLSGPVAGRVVSPVFHLIYVGPVLAPVALVPLGWTGLSQGLLAVGLLTAMVIWTLGAPRVAGTPPPLRPPLAIHLAPACVIASGAVLTGWTGLALVLALIGVAIAVALLIRGRWLLAAGFSPFWGALTFPMAAFGQSALRALGTPGLWLAMGVAVVASVAIPWIAWRILKDWPGGALARKTNAAIA